MIDAFGTDSTGRKCHEVFRKESSPCGHCTNDQLLDADGNPNSVCIWETKNPVTGKWYINYDRSIQWVDGRMVRLQIATDITERKQAEEKLQESETRYKSFIAHSTEGIYRIEIVPPVPIDLSPTDIVEWINKNAVVAEVNESLSSMYGLRPDDMVGKHATDFAPDYGKRAAKILEISNYRIVNEVTLDIDNTGNPLWLMENYHGEVHDRHLARIWGVQRNITDRKRIESQRDQQLHFTKALNEITETIISKDNSEDILESTNRIIGKTLQLDRALIYHVAFEKNCIIGLCEWLGQDHPDIALTKNEYPLNMFLSPFTEIKKTKNFLVSHSSEVNEHFIEDGSGKILHEQMNIKSLIWYPFAFDEHGYYVFALNQILKNRQWTKEEISFLESAAKQISIALIKIKILKEKGHLVATLRESEELFRVSMEKAPDGVYMNDLDGNFLYGNRKAEEIIGYRREELIGRNFLDFNMIAEASLALQRRLFDN
jgi:PAS domain S-box-containing protein